MEENKEGYEPERDAAGRFKPGFSGNPKGKPKGANSPTTAFKEAFDKIGGVPFLVKWAKKSNANMKVFYQLYARLLSASADSPEAHEFKIIFGNEDKHHADSDKGSDPDASAS